MDDTAISNIVVEGDILVNQNQGIVTRSKSKEGKSIEQFSMVPLRVKIIGLLIREYQVTLEEDDVDDEEEGEDWENEEVPQFDEKSLKGTNKSKKILIIF
jgi:hypothetical protein